MCAVEVSGGVVAFPGDPFAPARPTDMVSALCAVVEMQLRQLKSQLRKRGIKCDKCSQREHYMDILLDNAHLPHV